MHLCKCNCGKRVNKSWATGHHRRGTRFSHTNTAIEKIRESQTGKTNSMYGKIPHNWMGGATNLKARKVIYQQNREARKRLNGGAISLSEWNTLKHEAGYTCLACKRVEPEIKLTIDHITPISMGGRNDVENIQPLCFSCNSSKKA